MSRHIVLLALCALMALPLAAQAVDNRDPQTIVDQTTQKILGIIDSERSELKEDPERLHQIVRTDLLPLMDIDYSARLILGKAGRGVSNEQLRAFSDAMSDLLINRYADGLLDYKSGEEVQVLPSNSKDSDKLTRVRTRIKLDNGQYTPVDYAFHKTPDGWKAFDVLVEGISYVVTFRNQIVPLVESQGIEKVTQDIRAGNLVLKTDV
ncbi:MAG: ABC transporter substrate-binding protein [Lysobacterales bacterium]|jgi:phospholipid transport system substrate-binding protein